MLTVMLTVISLILLHFKHFSWLKNHAFTHLKCGKVMDLLTFPVANLLIFRLSTSGWLKIPSISYVLGRPKFLWIFLPLTFLTTFLSTVNTFWLDCPMVYTPIYTSRNFSGTRTAFHYFSLIFTILPPTRQSKNPYISCAFRTFNLPFHHNRSSWPCSIAPWIYCVLPLSNLWDTQQICTSTPQNICTSLPFTNRPYFLPI